MLRDQLLGARRLLRDTVYRALDQVDRVTGKADPLVPPRSLNFVGQGDFKAIGAFFLDRFVADGGLSPRAQVLDVGCGIGRIAGPLTKYLAQGSYVGLDIVPAGIEWCRKNISSRFPNFSFQVSDVYNATYNPKGKYRADDYVFPCEDGTFDFVILTSVFTHMLPADVENYTKQISRVMQKNGTAFITLFLWDDEARQLLGSGRSRWEFLHELSNCRVRDLETPENAVAFQPEFINDLFERNNLKVKKTVRGTWRTSKDAMTSQDYVILERE